MVHAFHVSAFEGVEVEENFGSQEAITRYRTDLLTKTEVQRAFVERVLPPGAKRIFEIGTGNGRLLLALSRDGRRLHGIDVSASRIRFAQKWAEDLGLTNVLFEVQDIFDMLADPQQQEAVDVALCITGAFGYLDVIREGGSDQVLACLAKRLAGGGTLILELYPFPQQVRACRATGHAFRTWFEFPPSDPFRFCLCEYSLSPDTGGPGSTTIRQEKRFIRRRDGLVDIRAEYLRVYTRAAMEEKLRWAGFHSLECYRDWEKSPYTEGESEKMVLIGRI